MTKAIWGVGIRLAGTVGLMLASVSCGDLTRQGTASSYLIINSLEAAPGGATSGTFGSVLLSDVIVVKDGVPSIYSDQGRVTFKLGLKDPGPSTSPATPTANNYITVNRYHVRYIRADGHNIEGVDVPYAFDDAVTVTVSGDTTAGFTAVRNQAKQEAPLAALALNPIVVSTLAEVTFYGHDQTGREVSAVGNLSVSFANFADPK
jgi:hypothetical protein